VKVAFIGTHGVGKTTLCFELAALLKRDAVNVDMVKEVARLSPLPINQRTSYEAQVWILANQISEEIRSASAHDVVVCDRSVLDNYAYLSRASGRQPGLERFLDEWLPTYDALFLVPHVGEATPDGVRDTDEQFVTDIDLALRALLAERSVPHTALPADARQDWARIAHGVVRAHPSFAPFLAGRGRPVTLPLLP
jgi:nicotinamide riboside kinase